METYNIADIISGYIFCGAVVTLIAYMSNMIGIDISKLEESEGFDLSVRATIFLAVCTVAIGSVVAWPLLCVLMINELISESDDEL
jgi:predicted benzoate:H+ symporter BenE